MKMNENRNQEYFRQTFDEVYAPEGLYGKVMNLNMEKKKFVTRNVIRAAVCVFTVTVGMFAAAGGICYAATGESLVKKIKVELDGEEKAVKWSDDGKNAHGEIEIPDGDGEKFEISIPDTKPEDMDISVNINKAEDTVEIDIRMDELSEETSAQDR